MIKNNTVILTIILVSFIIVGFGTCFADSLFDVIMSLPDAEADQLVEKGVVEFDTFLNDLIYYCESWGSSFDRTDKQTLKNDDSETIIILDSIQFDIDNTDKERHPIKQISVVFGMPENQYQLDYNTTVKIMAIIASLEYNRPSTKYERSSLLNQISNEFEANFDTAISIAQYGIPCPVAYPSKNHSYTISYTEDEGYRLTIVTARSEEIEDGYNEHTIPIEIISVTTGDSAGIVVQNNGDEDILEIEFRIRGYDPDGNFVNSQTEIPEGRELYNMSLFSAEFHEDNTLRKGDRFNSDISMGKQAALSEEIELAVQSYTMQNGIAYVIPEGQLYWFSSKDGYEENVSGIFTYDYPTQEIIEKSGSFSMGISTEYVFPEDGQDVTGFQIIGIRDGLLKNSDIESGDIIYGANDTLIYDDPFAIEKAKAQYVEGKDMVLKIKRDNDYLEIKVAA